MIHDQTTLDPNRNLTTMTTTLPANGFAKLLATEDISVMYDAKATTATFDTEARVLRMPMWKDMSRRLNDMLIGHEVGHALFTTMNAADIHTFLTSVDSKNMSRVMQYLNVVEDARIDRLIQRKFPGLRKDYRVGYPEMKERGFFGPMDADLDSYSLVDRINLNYKTDMTIPFDTVEQDFISRIDDVEDLDEVLEIVRDIYEYAQVHDSETVTPDMETPEGESGEEGEDQQESGQDSDDATGGAEGADSSSDESDDNAGSGEGSDSDESDGQEEGGSSSNSADSAEDGDSTEAKGEGTMESAADAEDDGSSAESVEVSSTGASDQQAPRESKTQSAMQDALEDATSDQTYWSNSLVGGSLPAKMDLDTIIVPFTEAKKDWDDFTLPEESTYLKSLRGSVTQLVQMFERKKRGAIFAKVQTAKTGTIDCTKLHTYKFNDDIFKRNTIVPNGKNHGIQMLIDWSGSMGGKTLSGCVSQVMLLAAFCKKAGIPFDCYAFTNNCDNDRYGYRHRNEDEDTVTEYSKVLGEFLQDGEKTEISGFRLIQIASSSLNKADFDLSMRILDTFREHGGMGCVPYRWCLSGTPLHEALMAMRFVIPEFRAKNNLDVVTMCVLTDGQGWSSWKTGSAATKVFDPMSRRTLTYDKRMDAGDCLVDSVRQLTGCNTIGFFATESDRGAAGMAARKNPAQFDTTEFMKTWRSDRAYEVPQDGHDLYFLLKPEKVETGNGLEDAVAGDLRSVRAQFKKASKAATASRTLLNRITDVLAENLV